MKNPLNIVPKLNANNFTLFFESQGNSFLFWDIVSVGYMISESLIMSNGKSVRVFIANRRLIQTRQEGESRSPEQTRQKIAQLDGLADMALREAKEYSNRDIALEDIQRLLQLIISIDHAYEYFDPYYWESSYEKSEINPAMKENVFLVQDFKNKIRDKINPIFFDTDGLLDMLARKISNQFGLPLEDILQYRTKEVFDLFDKKVLSNEVLQNRREAYLFCSNDYAKLQLFDGSQAKQFIEEFDAMRTVLENITIIKGKPAHHNGKIIRGKVKIVSRDYADPKITMERIAQMKRGDVLVSETTDPEMMPALEKAAAIITDVGGMLSHAAITARELNIPCIVGTGSASKVLKDGDTVEVDTERGIVTIVKRL